MISWCLQNAIVATLLAGIVSIVCRCCPCRPATRHALWLVVLLKLVTPPVCEIRLDVLGRIGVWASNAFESRATDHAIVNANAPTAIDAFAQNSERLSSSVAAQDSAVFSLPRANGESEIAAEFNDAETAVSSPQVIPLGSAADWLDTDQHTIGSTARVDQDASYVAPVGVARRERLSSILPPNDDKPNALIDRAATVFGVIWIAGVGAMCVIQAIRIRDFRRRLNVGFAAPTWLAKEVDHRAATMAVVSPRSWLADGVASPLIWGALKPTLVWPAGLVDGLSSSARAAVITHELAHLRRRDHWTSWLELVAGCLWWWNPVFWHARHQLRDAAEEACDAWVVSKLPDARRAYAEALIEVSQNASWRAAPLAAVAMGHRARHTFERRLTMILRDRTAPRMPIAACVGVAVLGLSLLSEFTQGQSAPEPVPPVVVAPASPNSPTAPASPSAPAAPSAPSDVGVTEIDVDVDADVDRDDELDRIELLAEQLEGIAESFSESLGEQAERLAEELSDKLESFGDDLGDSFEAQLESLDDRIEELGEKFEVQIERLADAAPNDVASRLGEAANGFLAQVTATTDKGLDSVSDQAESIPNENLKRLVKDRVEAAKRQAHDAERQARAAAEQAAGKVKEAQEQAHSAQRQAREAARQALAQVAETRKQALARAQESERGAPIGDPELRAKQDAIEALEQKVLQLQEAVKAAQANADAVLKNEYHLDSGKREDVSNSNLLKKRVHTDLQAIKKMAADKDDVARQRAIESESRALARASADATRGPRDLYREIKAYTAKAPTNVENGADEMQSLLRATYTLDPTLANKLAKFFSETMSDVQTSVIQSDGPGAMPFAKLVVTAPAETQRVVGEFVKLVRKMPERKAIVEDVLQH